jgi:hypothetical protein
MHKKFYSKKPEVKTEFGRIILNGMLKKYGLRASFLT